MLKIWIPGAEFWDENSQQFRTIKGCELRLEHSLVAISKWESKWKKPFLSNQAKTQEETLDYIRDMTMNPNVDPLIYASLTQEHIKLINAYIGDPMTASTVELKTKSGARRGSMVTSELIYYWMTAFQIPFECQKWHLNRLLMLIQICQAKNQPDNKKTPKKDMAKYNRSLNAARRAKMHSKG